MRAKSTLNCYNYLEYCRVENSITEMNCSQKSVDLYSDMFIFTYCLGQNRRQKMVFAS